MANENLYVDEEDAVLSGVTSGALAGSVGGPVGAVVGGVIGGGIALFGAKSQNEATKKAKEEADRAAFKASILKSESRRQVNSLKQTGRNLGASKAAGSQSTGVVEAPKGAVGAGLSSSGTF